MLIYQPVGPSIGGLPPGTYRVYVVDPYKFKLQDVGVTHRRARPSTGPAGSTALTNRITGSPFDNGDYVTYHAPPPVGTFGSNNVDVTSCGDSDGCANTASADNIFIVRDRDAPFGTLDDIGVASGTLLRYTVDNPAYLLSGLSNGGLYYAIRDSGQVLRLATSYCRAVGIDENAGGCQSGPGGLGGDDSACGVACVFDITLTPNKGDDDFAAAVHSLFLAERREHPAAPGRPRLLRGQRQPAAPSSSPSRRR